jgi:hypothetical protein
MIDFNDDYDDLAVWEEKRVVPLIAAWNADDVHNVVNDFRAASQACSFATTLLPIPLGTTNQSIGNTAVRKDESARLHGAAFRHSTLNFLTVSVP